MMSITGKSGGGVGSDVLATSSSSSSSSYAVPPSASITHASIERGGGGGAAGGGGEREGLDEANQKNTAYLSLYQNQRSQPSHPPSSSSSGSVTATSQQPLFLPPGGERERGSSLAAGGEGGGSSLLASTSVIHQQNHSSFSSSASFTADRHPHFSSSHVSSSGFSSSSSSHLTLPPLQDGRSLLQPGSVRGKGIESASGDSHLGAHATISSEKTDKKEDTSCSSSSENYLYFAEKDPRLFQKRIGAAVVGGDGEGLWGFRTSSSSSSSAFDDRSSCSLLRDFSSGERGEGSSFKTPSLGGSRKPPPVVELLSVHMQSTERVDVGLHSPLVPDVSELEREKTRLFLTPTKDI